MCMTPVGIRAEPIHGWSIEIGSDQDRLFRVTGNPGALQKAEYAIRDAIHSTRLSAQNSKRAMSRCMRISGVRFTIRQRTNLVLIRAMCTVSCSIWLRCTSIPFMCQAGVTWQQQSTYANATLCTIDD